MLYQNWYTLYVLIMKPLFIHFRHGMCFPLSWCMVVVRCRFMDSWFIKISCLKHYKFYVSYILAICVSMLVGVFSVRVRLWTLPGFWSRIIPDYVILDLFHLFWYCCFHIFLRWCVKCSVGSQQILKHGLDSSTFNISLFLFFLFFFLIIIILFLLLFILCNMFFLY